MSSIEDRFVELHPESKPLAEKAMGLFADGVTHERRSMSPYPVYMERGVVLASGTSMATSTSTTRPGMGR